MARKGDRSHVKFRAFRCNHCSHPFRRRIGKKKTTPCPKCQQPVVVAECSVIGPDKRQVLNELHAKKKHRLHIAHGDVIATQDEQAIRGDQIPIVKAEAKFKARAISLGYKVHRPSWPDNIIEKNGKLMFVEIKGASDEISREQAQTFSLLEKHGIPVYIWKDTDNARGSLFRWNDGVETKKLAARDPITREAAMRRRMQRKKQAEAEEAPKPV